MDYSSLNLEAMAEKGIVVKVKCPITGKQLKATDGTDLFITVLGTDSKQWKNELARIKREAVNRESAPTEEEIKSESIRALAAITVAWHDETALNGKKLACTQANAIKLYSADGLEWLLQQVSKAAGDRQSLFFEQKLN
jgi:hypothetical protein